ncbi:MAG: CHAD domain-containing protein [Verrucomicrobia bacterium]|nr:CHAD domain-containing protein [Verrucomicrobiota bacterium]
MTLSRKSSPRRPPDVAAHLERVLKERWRRYRKAFDRCRRNFSEDLVHQLRVETRRLVALLNLLDALVTVRALQDLRHAVKKLFRSSARLRDTQVQRLFVDRHRRAFPEISPFAKSLARLEKRLVAELKRRIRRTRRRDIKELVAALRDVLGPALADAGVRTRGEAIVRRHVQHAFNRVLNLRRRVDPDRPLTIHRTRVAFKRFRYLVELLQPLLPGITPRRLETMHHYQTMMGDIQDLEVLQRALDEFAKTHARTAPALQRFRQEIERQHARRIARYLTHADRLLRLWPLA